MKSNRMPNHLWVLLCVLLFAGTAQAASYSFSGAVGGASYPVCSGGVWWVSGSTYNCSGSIALASGDTILPANNITVVASAGIFLAGSNTVGSASVKVNLETSSGPIASIGSGNVIYGNLTSGNGAINLTNTAVTGSINTGGTIMLNGGSVTKNVAGSNGITITNGTVIGGNVSATSGTVTLNGGSVAGNVSGNNGVTTTNGTVITGNLSAVAGAISLSGGSVTGSVYSNCCTVTTTNTNIGNGVASGSYSVTINGGTIAGVISGAGLLGVTISNATITRGSIAATNAPIVISNSTIGSASQTVNITGTNTVTLQANTTVYGNVTAANWTPTTLAIDNTSQVFGICSPANVRCGAVVSALHHFHIDHYGAGVTCEPESVVISAHDSGHNLVTLANTSVALATSTNHGDWSKITANGALTNSGSGAGTYIFTAESQITLGLADTFAETTNVNVNAGGITENTGGFANHDPNITFADAGFAIVTASLTPATISTKIAGQSSDAGTGAQTLYLQAIKTDLSTHACTSLFPNSATPVNVNMAIQCVDPTTCQAVSPSITNSAGTTTTGIALNAAAATPASASYTAVPLVFGASSMALIRFNYPDAGQIRLLAAKAIPSTTSYMRGSSNAFVVRPYGFVVNGVAATASATRPAGGLVRAGESFTATLTATNLAGNATRNFGCESAPESVTLTPTVSAPAGGNNGSLYRGAVTPATFTGAALCGSGVGTATDLAWSEVGTATLTGSVTDNNYLGAGPVAGNASAALGRFYPDHFTLAGSVSVPCGFAYMGQPAIDITAGRLEARSLTGGQPSDQLVTNYRTGYPVGLATIAFVAADSDGVDRAARFSPAPTATAWTAGVYTISGTGLAFARDVAPDGPYDIFNLGLMATDGSDYAVVQGTGPAMTIGGCTAAGHCTARALTAGSPIMARYGRLRMANAIGSAKLPLYMSLEAQYRTAGGGYATNTADSCTSLDRSRILQGNAQKGLPVLTFAGANPIMFTNGRATLTIAKPGSGGSRDITVNLSATGAAANCVGLAGTTTATADMTYLRETWCGGTQHDPAARASFDVYRKDDRFIYQRENY